MDVQLSIVPSGDAGGLSDTFGDEPRVTDLPILVGMARGMPGARTDPAADGDETPGR